MRQSGSLREIAHDFLQLGIVEPFNCVLAVGSAIASLFALNNQDESIEFLSIVSGNLRRAAAESTELVRCSSSFWFLADRSQPPENSPGGLLTAECRILRKTFPLGQRCDALRTNTHRGATLPAEQNAGCQRNPTRRAADRLSVYDSFRSCLQSGGGKQVLCRAARYCSAPAILHDADRRLQHRGRGSPWNG